MLSKDSDWNSQTVHVADQELYAVIPSSRHLQIKPFNMIVHVKISININKFKLREAIWNQLG